MTTIVSPSAGAAKAAATVGRKSRVATKFLRWTILAVAVAAGSVGAWRYFHAQPAPALKYETARVDQGRISAKVTATGTVSAITTVQVGSQVSGRILAWYVDFNARVTRGQLVATIDPALFKAAVEQARANFATAKAGYDKALANRLVAERNYARGLALFEQSLASRSDLDAAEAQASAGRADVAAAEAAIQQATAALDQAQLNLSYTRITSPIDGIVISRNIDVGQTVAASFQSPTLFTIAQDLTKMQVDTSVAEGDVGKIREGMEASFTVDAYPTRTYRGIVRQVRDNAQTIQNVVTYDAVIDVSNADLSLRPTMTANCSFVYAVQEQTTRLPNAALRFKPDAATIVAMTLGAPEAAVPATTTLEADQRVVWVKGGPRPVARLVRLGISDGMVTQIVEGDVRAGDVLITEAVLRAGAHP